MTTIAQLLNRKGATVHTVAPDTLLHEAISTMVHLGIGALVVKAHSSDDLLGILAERDILQRLANGAAYDTALVCDCMSDSLPSITGTHNTNDALQIMTDRRIRHLPVLDNDGRLLGLVSIGDLVKAKLEEQHQAIEQLGNYIGGIPT
ncbi:MAG: CBS domain-containing protein [Planctomycetota bacterium]|nr:MAG: CBS domain-containing protein [Planctomycetota bacterium]